MKVEGIILTNILGDMNPFIDKTTFTESKFRGQFHFPFSVFHSKESINIIGITKTLCEVGNSQTEYIGLIFSCTICPHNSKWIGRIEQTIPLELLLLGLDT